MVLSQGQSFRSCKHIQRYVKLFVIKEYILYYSIYYRINIFFLFICFLLVCRLGAEWQRIRSILNPRMLKPKHVSSYTNAINRVVKDFIEKVAWLRATKGNGVMVPDVAGELYKFAFEGKTFRIKKCLQHY